ncbi:MAG TPA: hypothetical protein VKB28_06190, partial [Solirubrobacteraceae bacterium]|nr:hypothetical protein [Solirubrobacteraceae bacterium]
MNRRIILGPAAIVTAAGLLVASLAAGHSAAMPPPDAPLPRTTVETRSGGEAPARRSAPVRIEIPAIGVRARVVSLGLNADGTLRVPTRFRDAGWWAGGARPGERGPAVVVGHVDSYTGPA